MANFKRREIYEFKCCNEGRLVTQEKDKNNNLKYINQDKFDVKGKPTHFFLILYSEEYANSRGAKYISALPLTSSKGNFTVQEKGHTLISEDLERGKEFIGSNILFDRPVRVLKDYIQNHDCKGVIQFKSYNLILAKTIKEFGAISILETNLRPKD